MMGPFESQIETLVTEARPYSVPGLTFKVAMSPTRFQAKRMLIGSRNRELRMVMSYRTENYWVWDANDGFHREVAEAVGLDWYGDVINYDGTVNIKGASSLDWVYWKLKEGGVRGYHKVIVPPVEKRLW